MVVSSGGRQTQEEGRKEPQEVTKRRAIWFASWKNTCASVLDEVTIKYIAILTLNEAARNMLIFKPIC